MSTINTQSIRSALKNKFCAPEWVFLEEVQAQVAKGGLRSADAIAANLWDSRGYKIIGFEIKVSRADWLRELKNPAKADAIAEMCDEWIVVTPPGVVQPDELPQSWGLLELHGQRFMAVVKPPKLLGRAPLTRQFVASMLRRAVAVGEREIQAATQESIEKVRVEERACMQITIDRRTKDYVDLLKRLDELKAKTGIDLFDYRLSTDDIAMAIRYGIAEGCASIGGRYSRLTDLRNQLRALDRSIEELGPLVQELATPRLKPTTGD